jgi:hypothetical protein
MSYCYYYLAFMNVIYIICKSSNYFIIYNYIYIFLNRSIIWYALYHVRKLALRVRAPGLELASLRVRERALLSITPGPKLAREVTLLVIKLALLARQQVPAPGTESAYTLFLLVLMYVLLVLGVREKAGSGRLGGMAAVAHRARVHDLVADRDAAVGPGHDSSLGDGVDDLGEDLAEAVADGVGGVQVAADVGDLTLLHAGAADVLQGHLRGVAQVDTQHVHVEMRHLVVDADGSDAGLDGIGRPLALRGVAIGKHEEDKGLLPPRQLLLLHALLVLRRLESLALVDDAVDGMPKLGATGGVRERNTRLRELGAARPGQHRRHITIKGRDADKITLPHAARLKEQELELLVEPPNGPASHGTGDIQEELDVDARFNLRFCPVHRVKNHLAVD